MSRDELRTEKLSSGTSYQNFDATDRRIVNFLWVDGRTPYREIARQLKVSESMVCKRVNR